MTTGRIDNVTLAAQGYAVLMYTARGFGNSCGTAASRAGTPACAKGWVQLADQRYEVRDTQYLAGELVDEGFAKPGIAVSGVSYGGGQSLELAILKNRTALLSGKLVPFVSPVAPRPDAGGRRLRGVAVGRPRHLARPQRPPLHRGPTPRPRPTGSPAGVAKGEWDTLLYGVADRAGFLAPPGADPTADLTTWETTVAGEPFTAAEPTRSVDLQSYKSAIGIPMPKGGPAPTAIQSGWTDSLFPVYEALHFADGRQAAGSKTRCSSSSTTSATAGPRTSRPTSPSTTQTGIAFLDAVVLRHRAPATGVLVRAQTCPAHRALGPDRALAARGPPSRPARPPSRRRRPRRSPRAAAIPASPPPSTACPGRSATPCPPPPSRARRPTPRRRRARVCTSSAASPSRPSWP